MADNVKFERMNQRLDGIESRLGKLENQTPGQPSWATRAFHWALNHTGQSAMLLIALALLTIFGGGYFSHWLDHKDDPLNTTIDNRVTAILEKPDGVNATLKRIDAKTEATNTILATLQPYIQEIIRHDMDHISKLSPQDLEKKLPSIANVLQAAKVENIQVQPNLSAALRESLLRVPNQTTGYWPVAAALISTSSPFLANNSLTCVPKLVITDVVGREGVSGYVEASNCTLDLDIENVWQLNAKKGTFWDFKLHNVRLHYSGRVPLVGIRSMQLDQCSFDFHFEASPPENGRMLTAQLLKSADPGNAAVHV